MNARISVAPPEFDRWPEVLDLLRQSFAYMANRIDPPSSLNRLDLAGLRSKATTEVCVLAMRGEQIIGCAFLDPRTDCLYVGKVAVASDMRGHGIARNLFGFAEQYARERGLPFLELQTRVELVENHSTFGKLGFVRSGQDAHEGYDRPTSIRMRKPVTSAATQP